MGKIVVGTVKGDIHDIGKNLVAMMMEDAGFEVVDLGIDLSENGQALDAIHEVGPGGHFLGCAHTQKNFEQAFYLSQIADNNSLEQWEIDGSLDATARANSLWKQMLADYEAPSLDPGIDEALIAFMDAKKAAEPDSAY
jgi:trimethylamine--corrinoid protein Co-methyltransferase